MRIFHSPNVDFLGKKHLFIGISIALSVLAAVLLVVRGLNWGVDFTGGAQIVYAFSKTPDENDVRKIIEGAKVPVASVQRYDRPEKNQVLLRVPLQKKEGRDVSKEATAALTKSLFPKGLEPGVFDLNLNGADALSKKLAQDDPETMSARANVDVKVESISI